MARKIIIDGVIGWDIWGSKIRKDLDGANGEEVIVEISSPGGSVFDGLEIFNLIRDYSRKYNNVTVKIIGLAASMASYISLSGNKVIAEDNAVFMIHNVWGLSVGDYREMEKTANIFENLTKLLAKAYSEKTGKSQKEIRQLMDDETWLYGEEMQKAGFVDEMIESNNNDDTGKNNSLMLAKGRFDNCVSIMEKSEKSKNDLKKAAALINIPDVENNVIQKNEEEEKQENTQNTIKGEIKDMNEQELKEKYPDLYNKIFNDGVASANLKIQHVKAHLKFKDIAPKEVLDNIEKEKPFDIETQAEYGKIQMNVTLKNDRKEDDPGNLQTGDSQDTDQAETKAYVEKMKNRRGTS